MLVCTVSPVAAGHSCDWFACVQSPGPRDALWVFSIQRTSACMRQSMGKMTMKKTSV
jgi:hypothetical protein